MEPADLADHRLIELPKPSQPSRLGHLCWPTRPSLPSTHRWPSRLGRPTCPEGWCAEELNRIIGFGLCATRVRKKINPIDLLFPCLVKKTKPVDL